MSKHSSISISDWLGREKAYRAVGEVKSYTVAGRSEVIESGWEKRSHREWLGEAKSYSVARRGDVIQSGWRKRSHREWLGEAKS